MMNTHLIGQKKGSNIDAKCFNWWQILWWLCFLPFPDCDWIVLVLCLLRCIDVKMSWCHDVRMSWFHGGLVVMMIITGIIRKIGRQRYQIHLICCNEKGICQKLQWTGVFALRMSSLPFSKNPTTRNYIQDAVYKEIEETTCSGPST